MTSRQDEASTNGMTADGAPANGAPNGESQAETERLELGVARLLRVGVFVSGALLLAGWLLSVRGGNPFEAFSTYAPLPLADSLRASLASNDFALLLSYAGLFVLVALPPLRVFFTAVLLARARERTLAALAFFVLIVLALSFVLGWEFA